MTKAELESVERQMKAEKAVRRKKKAGVYGRKKKMHPPTGLGPPARVPHKSVKQVFLESDKETWIPASLYKFEPASPLTAAEERQFLENFRKRTPGKLIRLPDITRKMGQLKFD